MAYQHITSVMNIRTVNDVLFIIPFSLPNIASTYGLLPEMDMIDCPIINVEVRIKNV